MFLVLTVIQSVMSEIDPSNIEFVNIIGIIDNKNTGGSKQSAVIIL